ncbi:MAG: hypothetical protein AAGD11_04395 [Planctomycetota bacterium]
MRHTIGGVLCALIATSVTLNAGHSWAETLGGSVTGGTTTGDFELLASAPALAGPDAFDSPNLVAFDEQQDVELVSTLAIGPGISIPAGVVVSSHYVAFDPGVPSSVEGFIDFDEPILAVVGLPQSLAATESLFASGSTNYSVGPAVGPEFQNMDQVFVSPNDRARLVFRAAGNSPGDQVRVLTGIIPEPASIVLLIVAIGVSALGQPRAAAVNR